MSTFLEAEEKMLLFMGRGIPKGTLWKKGEDAGYWVYPLLRSVRVILV